MLEEMKVKVEATLKFQFIEHFELPKEIQILNIKKEIDKDLPELTIELTDLSLNEYKIYECLFSYESDIKTYSISVYYNKINYYLCGNGSHSVEIIFCDFIYKEIKIKNCFIEYKGVKYEPKENFELSTRKRINFVGIDIIDLKLPKSLEGKIIEIDPKFNQNILVTISVAQEYKVIGIYTNAPFIEPKIVIEKELLKELKNLIENASKPLNFKKEKQYLEYRDDVDIKNLKEYEKGLKSSYEFEKKLSIYLNFYKEKLNELEIELYDLYSEFMILFPDIDGIERNSNKFNLAEYKDQYYFSKSAILNFCSTIPESLEKSDKIKLKYAACRCLRTLLINGKGLYNSELFEFIDYNIEKTIYYEANNFNKKFIESLREKSEIFLFFLQVNSGSGINLLTKKNTARLSMLNENDIKTHLKSTIPKYGIIMKYFGPFKACTINEVRITCINECAAFGIPLGKRIDLKDDPVYRIRYNLVNLLQHEDFGHIKFSMNFYAFYDKYINRENKLDPVSPINYYNTQIKEGLVEIEKEEIKNGIKITKGESGLALTSFLTRGNIKLMLLLRNDSVNFTELFKEPSLSASEDLSEFIRKLSSLDHHSMKYDEKEFNFRIKYEDFYQFKVTPFGFPTTEKID